MKRILLPFLLFLYSFAINAQDFCKASSVFFDLNKSNLRPESLMTLDSLINSAGGTNYVLEIYGYTDTTDTDDYNRKLSRSRIDAVLGHFNYMKFIPKQIRTFNEGEDFNSNLQNKNAAFQRRVDIYLTPLEGNDVVFRSATGVTVKQDLSYFGDCGICALKPKMRYLQTEEEANANGIDLMTDNGEKLITYGMVLFDIDTCASVPAGERRKFRTCMQLPTFGWANNVRLFELVEQPGNDVWRLLPDTLNYDPEENTVSFCSYSTRINCDAYWSPYGSLGLILPEETTRSGKSFFMHIKPRESERLLNDTVNFPTSVQTVISYFSGGEDWYLFKAASGDIVRDFYNRDSVSPNFCILYVPDYTVVSPIGEIELKVKLKDYDKIGYYNGDFDLFVPLERKTGKIYSGQMYRDGFELCYIKKDKYYIEKNQAQNLRITYKNGVSKAKLKKFYLFKKNKLGWKRAKRRILS